MPWTVTRACLLYPQPWRPSWSGAPWASLQPSLPPPGGEVRDRVNIYREYKRTFFASFFALEVFFAGAAFFTVGFFALAAVVFFAGAAGFFAVVVGFLVVVALVAAGFLAVAVVFFAGAFLVSTVFLELEGLAF